MTEPAEGARSPVEVEVLGASAGLYGGIAPNPLNPLNPLAHLLAGLKAADGRITGPDVYDRVREVSRQGAPAVAPGGHAERIALRPLGP